MFNIKEVREKTGGEKFHSLYQNLLLYEESEYSNREIVK